MGGGALVSRPEEGELRELDASYLAAAQAARAATLRGDDPTFHWRQCQRFHAMARRARIRILVAEWS